MILNKKPTTIYGILAFLELSIHDAIPIHIHDAIVENNITANATVSDISIPSSFVHIRLATEFDSGSIPSGTVASTHLILLA